MGFLENFSVDSLKEIRAYEPYEEFLSRIFSFQKPDFAFGVERFFPSNSVMEKVSDSGAFNCFIGDTVVFDLDDEQKRFIQKYYINALYSVASGCLAEKLKESTLHMTLHDLNATNRSDFDFMEKVFNTELMISSMIRKGFFAPQTIRMVTTCVFNMVNTSLVLGLKPKEKEDYEKLMTLYSLLENVHHLPYPLTPHITLAYYCRYGFDGESLERLQNVVNSLNHENFEIVLSTDKLYYQKFVSMNDYFHIMRLA